MFEKFTQVQDVSVKAEPLSASMISIESIVDSQPANLSAYCFDRNIARTVFCKTKFIECIRFTNGMETAWPKNFILKKVGGDEIIFKQLKEFNDEVRSTQTVSVPFEITTPLSPGNYTLRLSLGYEKENSEFGDEICINITSNLEKIQVQTRE